MIAQRSSKIGVRGWESGRFSHGEDGVVLILSSSGDYRVP